MDFEFGEGGNVFAGLVGGEPEDYSWRGDGGEYKVDVEGPAPGSGADGEFTAYEGAKDSP